MRAKKKEYLYQMKRETSKSAKPPVSLEAALREADVVRERVSGYTSTRKEDIRRAFLGMGRKGEVCGA